MEHKLLKEFLTEQEETEKEEQLLEKKVWVDSDTYIYIKSHAKYYWVDFKGFFKPQEVCSNLLITNSELLKLRKYWMIKDYDNLTYLQGWKAGCYNLLNQNDIIHQGEVFTPPTLTNIHPHINTLIESVAWFKKENIEYMHKAILYKYLNINDHTLPAVVLYGKGWSGKGTLMSLLWTIFWNDNVLSNLWQRDLTGYFDTYRWQKLVVEFAEITTNNTNWDKKILNKLKNLIGAETIIVNEKWVKQYPINNIAWFFISSNSNKPLQLDDKDKWNRRFTILKSNSSLINGEEINNTVRNKTVVAEYMSWLLHMYPEVKKYKKLLPLDNQDKRELEERSMDDANQFWEWLEDNYPTYTGKRTTTEINLMIYEFCNVTDIEEREFIKYFWHNSKYPKKKIRIWEKTFYWVEIPDIK